MSRSRGFLLALTMLMIPVSLLMVFSLTRLIFAETAMSMQAQRRARAFYVAQAALGTAFHVFSCANYRGHTHEADGLTPTGSSELDFLETPTLPELARDSEGWYSWSWTGGNLADSFTRSGLDESYRFQIFFPAGAQFCIRVEANVGGYLARQEQLGVTQPLYDYVLFDNGNSSDFSRAEEHRVEGKVHANGDLFLRPWTSDGFAFPPAPLPPLITLVNFIKPAILTLKTDRITTAGKIVRSQDHLGNPDPGGYVTISKNNRSGPMVPLEGIREGGPYDSNHPQWRDPGPAGALSRYGGTVIDSELGAVKQNPPSRQALTPGGYYDRRAGLHIGASTSESWCAQKSFYNQDESREVTVKDLDVAALVDAGAFPSNGLIYADTPVRLVNAHRLPADMTLASSSTIYTRGDFNKDNPDASGGDRRRSAALMTTDRVYNLTSSFDDEESYTYPDPIMGALTGDLKEAEEAPLYPGDPPQVLEINAAICDGAPSNDVRAWVDEPGNPYFLPTNFIYGGRDTGVKRIPDAHDPGHPGLKSAYPNPDDYLENLQGIKVSYLGSTVHNRNAVMAGFNNAECATQPWLTAWATKSGYIPPKRRECVGDPRLVDRPPPGAPQAARKLLWREL